MQQWVRFSISGGLGFVITIALFLGMLSLLKTSVPNTSNNDSDIRFSFVKDFKAPDTVKPDPKELPEPKEVIQPPAAPTFAVNVDNSPEMQLPIDGISSNQPNILASTQLPGMGTGLGPIIGEPGGIKSAIPPMYPHQQLVNKTEGWVKLKFIVNEFGGVGEVTVIDAQPRRIFNAEARKAIKKWKFHPKIIDGKAVSFLATQTIEFKISQ